MLPAIAVFLSSLVVSLLFCWEARRRLKWSGYRLPPSLPNLPFVGSTFHLPAFRNTHKFFSEEAKTKGPLIGFHVLDRYNLVLNSKEVITEAFVKQGHAFSDRPIMPINEFTNPEYKGIMFHPYNDSFKIHHKLALRVFKEFGFGSNIMEERINTEIGFLVKKLKRQISESPEAQICINPTLLLSTFAMNIISSILFGKRFEDDDEDIETIVSNVRQSFQEFGKVFAFNAAAPYLTVFPFAEFLIEKSLQLHRQIFGLLERKVLECTGREGGKSGKMDESGGSGPGSGEMRENCEGNMSGFGGDSVPKSFIGRIVELEGDAFDKEQLLQTLNDLYMAGTETSASTLEWTLITMANHPRVQSKMAAELTSRLKADESPSLENKHLLKYCEAVVLELYRRRAAAPLTVPHVTSRDCGLCGFEVPAGTMVFANIYSVHMDPNIWDDPALFKPERFLDNNGDVINRDLIIPFSTGKRSCFGEMLARQEVFLSVCSLVRNFIISPPAGQNEIFFTEQLDITSKPSSFSVRLQIR